MLDVLVPELTDVRPMLAADGGGSEAKPVQTDPFHQTVNVSWGGGLAVQFYPGVD